MLLGFQFPIETLLIGTLTGALNNSQNPVFYLHNYFSAFPVSNKYITALEYEQ